MAKTQAQRRADGALEVALRRVIEAYDLLPAEPNVLEYLGAYHGIAQGIMDAAFDQVREAYVGETKAPGRQPQVRQ